MKRLLSVSMLLVAACAAWSSQFQISSPNGRVEVAVGIDRTDSVPYYTVTLDGVEMIGQSPLGFTSNLGAYNRAVDMSTGAVESVDERYSLDRIKQREVEYSANRAVVGFTSPGDRRWDVEFSVGDNDVAFRYIIPQYKERGSIYIDREETGYRFPEETTTFLTPQSDAMIGWKRTKPSYEEEYKADAAMDVPSTYGHGYTFPCLFRVGDNGWVLLSETGVDSHYCASRLGEYEGDGLYRIAFPMAEENNGNGNTGAALALPGKTPWRTITLGRDLGPIVETTVMWDLVKPLYETEHNYKYGRGTWSWILWQDDSINLYDLMKYVDLAAAMGYEYILVDNWWDTNIGRDKITELIDYAHSRGIDVFMWYSSSGYWNDIVQGPINCMDNPIVRKREMRWLKELGVKGIKVDFFGGDKQETMRLYEAILSDADDNGLMVIFHGCTIPRGWERMYPNYVGSEAVLASENIYFTQHSCDTEPFNATLHPFIRNTIGCMEFGGCFMNHYMSRGNDKGNHRVTGDAFELATTILFQNPIQNFALAPNNLTDAPAECLDFLRRVPTTWDETRFIDGYPGQYVVLARRSGTTWYIAGVNATDKPIELKLMGIPQGDNYTLYYDDKNLDVVKKVGVAKSQAPKVMLQPRGGVVVVYGV